ncbi:hypothetical protein K474DRAFT_1659601 [Panus rudis PR-1116 ss-1]|nr:hypothetical protein K474DRAFT_1659601 [Panus rudis PR-1116 ss-1]
MAKHKATDPESDVEMEDTDTPPKKQTKKKVQDESDVDDGGEEEEEEFEIEKILDHRRGMFEGRTGYLVKWKGYGHEDNSWVDENDVHAEDLKRDYWNSKKKGRPSAAAKQTPAKGRKSTASVHEVSEDEQQAAPPPRKRKTAKEVDTPEIEDEEEEEAPKPKKTKTAPRKSNTTKGRKSTQKEPSPEPEGPDDEDLGNMTKWHHLETWEHIVESIDTVERTDDGELYVYFTLKDSMADKARFKRAREPSSIIKKKMPERLIEFYEANLRWRKQEEED